MPNHWIGVSMQWWKQWSCCFRSVPFLCTGVSWKGVEPQVRTITNASATVWKQPDSYCSKPFIVTGTGKSTANCGVPHTQTNIQMVSAVAVLLLCCHILGQVVVVVSDEFCCICSSLVRDPSGRKKLLSAWEAVQNIDGKILGGRHSRGWWLCVGKWCVPVPHHSNKDWPSETCTKNVSKQEPKNPFEGFVPHTQMQFVVM